MFPSVMIIDDEPSIRQSLGGLLADEGFEVLTASNGYEALKIIDKESPDLVLLDVWMPGMDGIETLKEIKKENPFIQVIIITGHGTIETAVNAIKLGAYDFIEKPLSIDKVIVAINNALNFRRLEEENRYLRKKTIEKHSISGNSAPVNELKRQIATVAPTDSWVLITGENGTGKELVARTIHQLSPRVDHPFIDVNCAAISRDHMEMDLFGREKGIIGQSPKQRGKLELADKGTLFLDEIGDMSLETQAKILRVLQEQKFQRVGGGRSIRIDVRVIAATNKDLELEIEKGRFRQDLYYRLNVVPIKVPALRERVDDIPVLVETFISECARQNRSREKAMTPQALEMLCQYPWPGNVRELKNLIGRLMIMVSGDTIDVTDLPGPYNPEANRTIGQPGDGLFEIDDFKTAMARFEAAFFQKKLGQLDGDIHQVSQITGVPINRIQAVLGTDG